ncbi:MAG: ornithine carbamoyltransferase [Chloroflexota bacterium]|nr:MAG: ornithine carbamoyltransferase [Chloroflexota bacterium]
MPKEAVVRPRKSAPRHVIAIADLTIEQLRDLLDLATELKAEWTRGGNAPALNGRVLAMLFERPSLRTRVSFEVATRQLGGHAMYLAPQEVDIGHRETVADAARVLSRYVNGIVIRTSTHQRVQELANWATVPVINGLSDLEHPCQALADLLTIREHRGALRGLHLAYIGDGNNVCHSLALAACKSGMHMVIGSPIGYWPNESIVNLARESAQATGGSITVITDPVAAIRGADVIYTDTWISMGQERESAERRSAFAGFQVNANLIRVAGDAVVMHCLPAHRGEEITDEVIDGPDSIVFDQAENRLHAQKAVLHTLMGG